MELSSEREVRSLRPDFHRLSRVPTRGTIVTSRADEPGFDFVSRFFAPAVGIDEDPVTSSAHCGLAPYWGERLGKPALRAFGATPRGEALELDDEVAVPRAVFAAILARIGRLRAAPRPG